MPYPALVIHGGAMALDPQSMTPKQASERLAALHEALQRGYGVLKGGGSALEAAIEAVISLEDCPLFNAGKGAVLAADGTAELDAAVMDGMTGRYGGVSAVKTLRNPVLAARAVMDHSPHSLLGGRGAEIFAAGQGLVTVDNSYFVTEERLSQLDESLRKKEFSAVRGLSTVGAVARDAGGNLAAATSTGGLTGKLPGRVSDSSVAGAGTWAANGVCALSCTGTGDVFLRNATARDVACLVEYRSLNLADAARNGLEKVRKHGGIGGIIGLAPEGGAVMEFNSSGMSRGFMREGAEPFAAIF